MIASILGFIFSLKFAVGAVAGAIVALILKNNLSKAAQAKIQADLNAANTELTKLKAGAASSVASAANSVASAVKK